MKDEKELTAVESERKCTMVSELVELMTDAQMDDHPREFIAEILRDGYSPAISGFTIAELEEELAPHQ